MSIIKSLLFLAAMLAIACRFNSNRNIEAKNKHERQAADFGDMLITRSRSIQYYKLSAHLKTYYLTLSRLETANANNTTIAKRVFDSLFKNDDLLTRDTACFMFGT